ncbi:MAG: AsmA family protein [Bacteroidota bacterium]
MKKFLLRFLLIIGIFFAVVFGGLAIILSFFEDTVSRKVVESINNNLTSELRIEDVDLTLFRSFPSASINLRQTILEDINGDALLEAENVGFQFKVLSLLGESIKITTVLIENGALVVRYDKNGNANYDVFRSDELADNEQAEDAESSSDLAISLEEAILRNIEFIYENEQSDQYAYIVLDEADFTGEFGNNQFELISEADFQTRFVEYGEDRFLSDRHVYYNADILVNLDEGLYELKKVQVGVEENAFDLSGRVATTDDFTDFNVLIKNEEGDLGGVLQLLPASYAAYLQGFKSKGQYYFDALVDGRLSQTENPILEVKFGLEEGRISSPRLKDDFRDVSFDAVFSNGDRQRNSTARFEMPRMKGYFDNELVELKLNAYNFDDPSIDFALNGTLPLDAVYGLFGRENITGGSGEVEVKDLEVRGKLSDMQQSNRIDRVEASGLLQFDDARLDFIEDRVTIDRGDILLEGNSIVMKEIKIEGAGSEIYLDGSCYNLIPVLFADSLNSKRAELEFEANLNAPEMDLDRLIALTTTSVEEEDVTEEVYDSIQVAGAQQREQFTQFLKGSFNANIEEFNYEKVEGEDFKGRLQFDNNELSIVGNTKAMEGSFDLSGTMYFEQQPRLKAKLIAKNIDAYEFFHQSENFGQDILTDQNIRGTMNTNMVVYAFWDEQMNFDYERLRVLAGIGIEEGELNDFELFESFSTFIKMKDLERVRFQDMQNWLEINNERIYIPVMFIQTNAINLTLNGEYTFDYAYDFNIRVNAGQVAANRLKRHDPDLVALPAKRKGFFNLYYKVTGQDDAFDYEMANKEVKRDFERSERRKNQIRESLLAEFQNIVLIREPQDWGDDVKYENATPEELEFLFEEGLQGGQR